MGSIVSSSVSEHSISSAEGGGIGRVIASINSLSSSSPRRNTNLLAGLTGTGGGSSVLLTTTATGSIRSVKSSLLELTSSLGLSALTSGGSVLQLVVSALGWLLG